jgi:hypothetical protein
MSKADRIAGRLEALETDYRAKLFSGLRACAAGSWGLFGQNEHLLPARYIPSVVEELTDLGADIDRMRERLGLEPFSMHSRFLLARGQADANAPGEPKRARAWLDELGET